MTIQDFILDRICEDEETAKRMILQEGAGGWILKTMAMVWSDHPRYESEWAS